MRKMNRKMSKRILENWRPRVGELNLVSVIVPSYIGTMKMSNLARLVGGVFYTMLNPVFQYNIVSNFRW